MEVEHLSPSRWRGSAASAAVPDVARARALLPHGGRTWTLGQKIKGHFWLTEERCQEGRSWATGHRIMEEVDGWTLSKLRYRVITIQLRFDDQDAMLDDTLTGKGGQGMSVLSPELLPRRVIRMLLKLLVQVVGHGGGKDDNFKCMQTRTASILARLETDTVE
uniref:Uncharacterized protein n=1 Tax=Oryza rufipogon TaxID=4529 RepID=A0A0E0NAS3_ORYRU